MKILIIRHGEPNYELDCLTENGRKQAALLGERLKSENITAAFTSPMGRAVETAEIALAGTGLIAETLDWLHEFDVKVRDNNYSEDVPVWDIYPENWMNDKTYYDKDSYYNAPAITGTEMKARYDSVQKGADELLSRFGLIREGGYFRKQGDTDITIALFCHFGAGCVTAAHLLGLSPVLTLQGFSAEPTAIATICTDDRFGDKVNFRMHGYGDINHLEDKKQSGINYK